MRKLVLIFSATFLLTSCHLATKGDLADLRRHIRDDVQQEVTDAKDEVRSEILVQSGVQSEQIADAGDNILGVAEAHADQIEQVKQVIEERIPEHRSLAGEILLAPWWIRGIFGMLISITLSMLIFVILKWNEVRLKWITSDEAGALTLVEMIIQKILSRRPDPLADPEPPEDDGPQLRVVK